MLSKNSIYRLLMAAKHHATAWNTLGHGIHSPSLYYLVSQIIYDDNLYYSFSHIENERQKLQKNNTRVFVEDFGTGTSGERTVAEITNSSAESKQCHRILFKLIQAQKAVEIVELGTSVGIGTAYLASTSSSSHVTTFEGSKELISIAQGTWNKLGIKNISPIVGNIDDTLPTYIDRLLNEDRNLDFAFIDANHTEDATKRYFDALCSLIAENSIIAIDDIYHSPEMRKAWQEICKRQCVTATIDCYHFGLVFFNRQYEKQTYKLRI